MPRWQAYTDGHCDPNPGRGGWGVVLIRDGEIVNELNGYDPATTNNRMEIQAIVEAISLTPEGDSIEVVTDSLLAMNVLSGQWRAKANLDIINHGKTLIHKRKVTFRWMRGHNGDRLNERADELAGQWQVTEAIETARELLYGPAS